LEDGHKEYVTVGDGSLIPVYMHRIVVQLALEEFDAMIGFSKQLGIGFNIIGRRDILKGSKFAFFHKKVPNGSKSVVTLAKHWVVPVGQFAGSYLSYVIEITRFYESAGMRCGIIETRVTCHDLPGTGESHATENGRRSRGVIVSGSAGRMSPATCSEWRHPRICQARPLHHIEVAIGYCHPTTEPQAGRKSRTGSTATAQR